MNILELSSTNLPYLDEIITIIIGPYSSTAWF